MPLRAVTFDLWETLITDSRKIDGQRSGHRVREIGRILEHFGLRIPAADLELAHARVWDECSRSWERAVDLPFEGQISLFMELARPGLSASVDPGAFSRIAEAYAAAALLYPPALIDGVSGAMVEMRSRGLRLGLICNTGRTPGRALRRLLSDFGILPLLDVALFSDETICRKPDPRIFRAALDSLGAAPADSVHVGDSLENDVRGALGAGMRSVWVRGANADSAAGAPTVGSVAELPDILSAM
jgi:putative hydrolase of the HAD superfamily